MELRDPIVKIKGIGEKKAQAFYKAGIYTVNDLLHYFPRNYGSVPAIKAIGDVEDQEFCVITGRMIGGVRMGGYGAKKVLSFSIADGSGKITVTYFNMPYLKNTLHPGSEYLLMGPVTFTRTGVSMRHPKMLTQTQYEELQGHLLPVYPLVQGMTQNMLTSAIKEAVGITGSLKEYLPEEVLVEEGLPGIGEAILKLHMPQTMEEVYTARKRLAFDEFFFFFERMSLLKTKNQREESVYVIHGAEESTECKKLSQGLPYEFTGGQKQAIRDIAKDLSGGYAMNRLLQGDVGCGKTMVAFCAALMVIEKGFQAAVMVPTEVLAAQHYREFMSLSERLGLSSKPVLLTGSLKKKEKDALKEQIASGEINLIIGTHALIQDDVKFYDLALVVTDEQHRFGVRQRMLLSGKGAVPHALVMSATPIPRTLGLILYGDLDISTIRELPAKRLSVKNAVVGNEYRRKIYELVLKEIRAGHQAYFICSMVEEGETEGVLNVTDHARSLRDAFPEDIRVESLHGRMKNEEKDAIMRSFASGEIDILVSTTVVEVGVNVPNATIMVVENAERFGLSALHQLRGRIGRGEDQSYCVFVAGNPKSSEKTRKRLEILRQTNDGFEIANEDLKQRGPGDFFGYRQSGDLSFQIADIFTDADVMMRAKEVFEKESVRSPESFSHLKKYLDENVNFTYVDFHGVCL